MSNAEGLPQNWNKGWTLTELLGADKIPADIPSCWLFEYTGNSVDLSMSMVAFDGMPTGGTWEENAEYQWITIMPSGPMNLIEISGSGAENGAEGYLRYMDASGNYICSIVVRLNIAE